MEVGMAKYFASEAAMENSIESMRIHGGYGYSKEYHVERYFRDAPLMCIGEGTNEIQRIIIAKQLIARNPRLGAGRRNHSVLPLQGIRILAIESYGAGPYASMHLADLGAEVIKIENPARPGVAAGDSARQSGPFFLGENDSQFFQTFNRNKRSVVLDLRKPTGYAAFLKLVAKADAVMNNLRGDQPGKLRITYDDLKGVNPRIVCGHLSGYGRTGPRASWPAYDYLAQAEAGYLDLTGEPGSLPTRMGLSIIDYMSGVTAGYAVTAALLGAARSGQGCDIDVTLYDVAMHQLTYPATWYLNEGYVAERRPRSGHPSVVPSEMFPTATAGCS